MWYRVSLWVWFECSTNRINGFLFYPNHFFMKEQTKIQEYSSIIFFHGRCVLLLICSVMLLLSAAEQGLMQLNQDCSHGRLSSCPHRGEQGRSAHFQLFLPPDEGKGQCWVHSARLCCGGGCRSCIAAVSSSTLSWFGTMLWRPLHGRWYPDPRLFQREILLWDIASVSHIFLWFVKRISCQDKMTEEF